MMKRPCLILMLLSAMVAILAPPASAADVYSALDELGPSIVSGHRVSPDTKLSVQWDGYEPTLHLNGVQIDNVDVIYERDQIRTFGMIPGFGAVQAVFSLDPSGNVIIQTSALNGTDGLRLSVAVDTRVARAEVCVCYGSASNPTRACTNAECDDPGTQCNTSPPAASHYCQWREQRQTDPVDARPVGGSQQVVK